MKQELYSEVINASVGNHAIHGVEDVILYLPSSKIVMVLIRFFVSILVRKCNTSSPIFLAERL